MPKIRKILNVLGTYTAKCKSQKQNLAKIFTMINIATYGIDFSLLNQMSI